MSNNFKFQLGDLVECAGQEWYVLKQDTKFNYTGVVREYTVRLVVPDDGNYWEQTVSEETANQSFILIRRQDSRALSGGPQWNDSERARNEAKISVDYSSHTCYHPKKYINKVFTTAFWVCPDCGKDLGNA